METEERSQGEGGEVRQAEEYSRGKQRRHRPKGRGGGGRTGRGNGRNKRLAPWGRRGRESQRERRYSTAVRTFQSTLPQ